MFDGWYTTGGEKVDLTRVYSSNTVLYARWSEYIAPSPNVKKAPVILLATSPDTVTEGEQVMLSVSETSGFGVDLSGVTYTADPSLPISGTGRLRRSGSIKLVLIHLLLIIPVIMRNILRPTVIVLP